MPRSLALVSKGHFNKATAAPDEYVIYSMDANDLTKWYVLIRNVSGKNNEFIGGEYLFEINLPSDFPHNPPGFYARTPNGLYEKDKICCISIGQYHKAQYLQTLGVRGFCTELANGLCSYDDMIHSGGINLIRTSIDKRKRYAQESRAFNYEYYGDIMEQMEIQYKKQQETWVKKEIQNKYEWISRSVINDAINADANADVNADVNADANNNSNTANNN